MSARPSTFGELLQRLAPPPLCETRCWGPIVASLRIHNAQASQDATRIWVILHSTSDWETQLIHPQPLRDRQYEVEIVASEGEVLRFVLDVGYSTRLGDLYQSSATVSGHAAAGLPTHTKA
jgi:hypothetical protein